MKGRERDRTVGGLALTGGALIAAAPAIAYGVAFAASGLFLLPGLALAYGLCGFVWLVLGLVGIQAGLRARKGSEVSVAWLIADGVVSFAASAFFYGPLGLGGIVGGVLLVASGLFAL